MLHSMTGYGSNSFKVQDLEIDIEVKSLNSRYFDSKISIPSALSTYELEIDNIAKNKLVRGKVCLLYTSPSPRDIGESRMPSSA